MSLLIATCSPQHIVISADGLCIVKHADKPNTYSDSDDLQKIFPIPGNTVAIAHHGENVIDDIKVCKLLPDLFDSDVDFFTSATLDQVAERIARELDKSVGATLTRVAMSEKCGFWICGFGDSPATPKIIEIGWIKAAGCIEHRRLHEETILMSGSGHHYIKKFVNFPIDSQFSSAKLSSSNEKYHSRYQDKLWSMAEKAQSEAKETRFGGRRHRLIIRRASWNWLEPP